jgi:hypothetical protein
MFADCYLQYKLRLKCLNSVEIARVLAETLKINVKAKYLNSLGELINEFSLHKVGGICGIINNICRFLQAVTRYFDVTDRWFTKAMRSLAHLFWWLLMTWKTYQVINSLLNEIKLTETTKLNKYRDGELRGLGLILGTAVLAVFFTGSYWLLLRGGIVRT